MLMKNTMLSFVEQEKSFRTLGPGKANAVGDPVTCILFSDHFQILKRHLSFLAVRRHFKDIQPDNIASHILEKANTGGLGCCPF